MSKRIETKTSRTAEFTCLVRYLSFLEKREQLKSNDFISPVIMNTPIKGIMHFQIARKYFIKKIPTGMYGYVIARAKYIDETVKTALANGVEQILIPGAGFDTRGIRFHELASHAQLFELDAPATQEAKIERYKEKGITLPDNLVFIPIDFDKQSLVDRLSEYGFKKGKKCLIIMEGLTMYLQPASIDSLFSLIQDFTGKESKMVFDFIYASVLKHENLAPGGKELLETTSQSGETFCFGLEKEQLPGFLAQYGFKVVDLADSPTLEERYFRDKDGKLLTPVNGTHCLVTASKL